VSVAAVYNNFSRGMNLKITPVAPGQDAGSAFSIMLQNFILDELGAIRSRRGYEFVVREPIYDSTGINELSWNHLFVHEKADGTYDLIGFAGDKAVKIDYANKVYTTLKTGLAENTRWVHTKYYTKSYFSNGSDSIQTWDGTDWSDLSAITTIPTGITHVLSHRNHLFLAKDNVIYFSPIEWNGTSDNWLSDADYTMLEPYTGTITGIISDGTDIAVTTRRATHIIYGSSKINFEQAQIDRAYGCSSQWTMDIIDRDGNFMWWSDSGAVICDKHSVQLVSSAIDPLFRNFNTNRYNYTCGRYYGGNDVRRNWYLFSVAMADSYKSFEYNNYVLCYNVGLDGKPIDYDWIFKHVWDSRRKFSTNRLRLKYRVINDATLDINYADVWDNELNTSQTLSLRGFEPGKILDSLKYGQEDVWQNYPYLQGILDISHFGNEIILRISNSEIAQHIAIHELLIEGNPRGYN